MIGILYIGKENCGIQAMKRITRESDKETVLCNYKIEILKPPFPY